MSPAGAEKLVSSFREERCREEKELEREGRKTKKEQESDKNMDRITERDRSEREKITLKVVIYCLVRLHVQCLF